MNENTFMSDGLVVRLSRLVGSSSAREEKQIDKILKSM